MASAEEATVRRDVDEAFAALVHRRSTRGETWPAGGLRDQLESDAHESRPLRLFVLWGCGAKDLPDEAEARAIGHLGRYVTRVRTAWSHGVRITAIAADTHAILNGHDRARFYVYFEAVGRLLHPLADLVMMSELWLDVGGFDATALTAEARSLPPSLWSDIDQRLRLTERAVRCSRRDPPLAARMYWVVRRRESSLLAQAFAGWIHICFEEPGRVQLLPLLPTVFLWAQGRGRAQRPWFSVPQGPYPDPETVGQCVV